MIAATNCTPPLIADSQDAVTWFLANCHTETGEVPALEVKQYTESSLNISPLEFKGMESLDITESEKLQSISVLQKGLGDASVGAVSVTNLPNLRELNTSILDTSSILLKNLTLLQTWEPSLYGYFGVDSFFTIENIGGAGSKIVMSKLAVFPVYDNSTFTISNSALETISLATDNNFSGLLGKVSFTNPPTYSPFNITVGASVASTMDMVFSNVAILSAPGIQDINGSFSLTNSPIKNLSFTEWASLEGDLTLENLTALETVGIQALTSVGGSVSIKNTSLKEVSLFFHTVGGDLQLSGDFTSVQFFELTHLGGKMDIQTTSAALNCSDLQKTLSSVVPPNNFACVSKLTDHSSSLPTQESTASSSAPPSKASKTASIVGSVVGSVVGVGLLVLCFFIMHKRRQRRRQDKLGPRTSRFFGRVEMEQRPGPVSVQVESGGGELLELPGEGSNRGELEGTLPVIVEIDGEEWQKELAIDDEDGGDGGGGREESGVVVVR